LGHCPLTGLTGQRGFLYSLYFNFLAFLYFLSKLKKDPLIWGSLLYLSRSFCFCQNYRLRYTDKNIKSKQNKKQNKLKWFDQSLVDLRRQLEQKQKLLDKYRRDPQIRGSFFSYGVEATFFIPDIFIWHKWEIFVIFFMCKVYF
jgi:hypothetical protein